MVDDLKITSGSQTIDKYYYFILEYENKDDQNSEMGQALTGNITILGAKIQE